MPQRCQTAERSKKLSELRRDLLQIEKQIEALRQSISVLEAQLIREDHMPSGSQQEALVARIVEGVISNLTTTSTVANERRREYLREKEAAEYIGVSVFSLRSWRSKGSSSGPPYIRLGRIVVYPVAELEAHMRARVRSNRDD